MLALLGEDVQGIILSSLRAFDLTTLVRAHSQFRKLSLRTAQAVVKSWWGSARWAVTGQAQCGGDKHCLRHLYILEVLLGSASIVPLTQQWSSAILRHVRSAGFSLSHRQERACIGAAEECGDATAAHALRLCAEPPSAKGKGYATPPAAKKWAKIASAGGSGFERGAEDDSHCLDSEGRI